MTRRVCLWSGPRNVSTALMYSFAQRADTRVVDEPLYAHYLRVSGADHPGRDDVLAAQSSDGEQVVRDEILGADDRPVVFFKQMAHHLVELDRGFLAHTVNVFLIRDPREMLPSLAVNLPEPTLADTGLALQAELLEELRRAGQDPPVLDARLLLEDPAGRLRSLCRRLELGWDESMLAWPAGRRDEDGVWAPHWYDSVHRSTGFAPYRAKTAPLPEHLRDVHELCQPHYATLRAEAERL